jgi:predicted GIY-YIG superfamily endonuclease
VYVLQNATSRHYIGLSENVSERLIQHNAGESKWSAKHRPWMLVWQSSELSLSAARRLENYLKQQKGGNGFYQYTGLRPPNS